MSIRLAIIAAILSVPTCAFAQGYGYPPPPSSEPPPPPPPSAFESSVRHGLTLGFGAGIGSMESSSGPIECDGCEDSVSGSFDAHIGVMLSPRLSLQFEVWGAGQALDAEADTTLVQVLALGAVQYWVTPRLWVKGGLGTAHLSMSYADSETNDELDTGGAAMAAVGYELIHRPRFALDVQLRGGTGTYDVIDDQISQGMLQFGLSWF